MTMVVKLGSSIVAAENVFAGHWISRVLPSIRRTRGRVAVKS